MKVNIAVIEDESVFVDHLSDMLKKWSEEQNHLISIRTYFSGTPFLSDWEDGIDFDVIFIDVMLPSALNGIEIANEIRKTNKNVVLIFVTSIFEKMGEGYRVAAMQYLIKPAKYEDICTCMNKVADAVMNQKSTTYCFQKSKNTLTRIPYREILYFESSLQYTEIYTTSSVEKQLERLKNIETLLPHEFVRCHRSYIVNIEAIYSITPSTITLINKTEIPLSKTYFDSVKERISNYFRKEFT